MMRAILLGAWMLTAGFFSQPAWADIYSWVDADGIRHISDVNPPPGAQIFLRTPSTPAENRVEEALAREEEQDLRKARRAKEEERMREQRVALENRLAETEAKVEDAQRALERVQERLEAARARYESNRRYAGSLVYGTRFFGTPQHDRFKQRQPLHRKPFVGSVFLERPFQLGAITIPLLNFHDPFRRTAPRHTPNIRHRSAHGKPHPRRRHGGNHLP